MAGQLSCSTRVGKLIILFLGIISLLAAQTVHLRTNGYTSNTNISTSNLDVSRFSIITLDNSFKLLIVTSPKFAGVISYGVFSNFGALESPAQYPRLDQLLLDVIQEQGSKGFPNSNLQEFFSANDVYASAYENIGYGSLICTVPATMGNEAVSRINDAYLNPTFSASIINEAILSLQEDINNLKTNKTSQYHFYKYFTKSPISNAYSANAQSSIKTASISSLNASLIDEYQSFISADIMGAVLGFETYNSTLVDAVISSLQSLPNANAAAKLSKLAPLKALNDSSKLYVRLNSTSSPQINFYVIPVEGSNQLQNYDWILILRQLVNSQTNGLIQQLSANFPQIHNVSNAVVAYLNKNQYPYLQITIELGQFSAVVGPQIYNFIASFFNQTWDTVYSTYGSDIIKSLQYKFARSPFQNGDPYSEHDVLKGYLFNLLNYGAYHSLDAQYYVDYNILKKTGNHRFTVVAVQQGRLLTKGDGVDDFSGQAYQFIIPPSSISQVQSPSYKYNPYNLGIPATPQFSIQPSQKWPAFVFNSIVVAPNQFITQPFSSATAIIHYNSSNINPNFAAIFFGLLENYFHKSLNQIYDYNTQLIRERSIYSLSLFGLKDSIFLLFNNFFQTANSTTFYSENDFNNLKNSFGSKYANYYQTQSIRDILAADQNIAENSILLNYSQLSSLMGNYVFTQFQNDQKNFLKAFSIEWLVVTFKDQISEYEQAVINVHYNQNLSYYTPIKINKRSINTTNIFTHKGQKQNALLLFADYGSVNQANFADIQTIDLLVTPLIAQYSKNVSNSIAGNIHLTLDGRVGYNIEISANNSNTEQLKNQLLIFSSYVNKTLNLSDLSQNGSEYYQNMANKLNLNSQLSIQQQTSELLQYIYAGCYQCVTTWPTQILSSLSTSNLQQAKNNAINALNQAIEVIEIPN